MGILNYSAEHMSNFLIDFFFKLVKICTCVFIAFLFIFLSKLIFWVKFVLFEDVLNSL